VLSSIAIFLDLIFKNKRFFFIEYFVNYQGLLPLLYFLIFEIASQENWEKLMVSQNLFVLKVGRYESWIS